MLTVRLMYRDRDVDLDQEMPPNEDALVQDLELNTLFGAMAPEDPFLFDMARRGILSSVSDPGAITYRQEVLADCLDHPAIIREIYDIAVAAIEGEKKFFLGRLARSPDTVMRRSVRVLGFFVGPLRRLREIADEHGAEFRSEGCRRFFDMLESELGDAYIQTIEGHLRELDLRRGALISAKLGKGNRGTHYVLRKPRGRSWLEWLPIGGQSSYSFEIADRDMAGAEALSRLRAKGINLAANAVAQATDHVLAFFGMLRAELAFYVGCLNLHDRLDEKGEPTCFPVPVDTGEPALCAAGLYDIGLTMHLDERVIGNELKADGKLLVMVTGANQGGKSTFLRSVGVAQLLMQCGMFVPAESFRANVCRGVFTHYKREEDSGMERGKLDEELARMDEIVDAIGPDCLLLCNESFSSTNEREGSEIARQIVRALVETDVKVFYVSHLFDLAQSLYRAETDSALFLRAERASSGRRTFQLVEGPPLPTSFGEDVYRRVFGSPADVAVAEPPG